MAPPCVHKRLERRTVTHCAKLAIMGMQAMVRPISSTPRKKKLELEARKGRVAGRQLCIKVNCKIHRTVNAVDVTRLSLMCLINNDGTYNNVIIGLLGIYFKQIRSVRKKGFWNKTLTAIPIISTFI